jgi:mono/diheme cytochrome c family protein
MFVLSVWMVAGCWSGAEQERARRVWEMQDHEMSTIAARDALLRGDLAGARTAGEDLARQDPVPGLPDGARGHLDAVRAAGERLGQAADAATAASELVGVTEHCAACHAALGIEVVRPMRDTPREHLWLGLVFEDEASWAKGVSELSGVSGLDASTGWPDRRAALAPLLESAAL